MLISSSLSGIIKLIVIHAIHIWVCLCQRLSVSQQLREISLKKGGGQRIRVHLWIKLINHYWHWDKFKRGALKCTPLKWTLHLGIGDMVSISNFSPNFPDNAAHNWSLTALFKKTKQNPVLDTRFFCVGEYHNYFEDFIKIHMPFCSLPVSHQDAELPPFWEPHQFITYMSWLFPISVLSREKWLKTTRK